MEETCVTKNYINFIQLCNRKQIDVALVLQQSPIHGGNVAKKKKKGGGGGMNHVII